MLKAIKIRLYPSDNQIIYINKLLGTSRFIYNQCLNYKITEYQSTKKSTSLGETGKFLTSLKNNYNWIRESQFLNYEYEKWHYDNVNLRELTFKEFVSTYTPLKELRKKKLDKISIFSCNKT